MNCPVCSTIVAPVEVQCPKCGTNLTEYAQVCYMPDRLFNQALSRMRHRRFPEAAELLCRAAGLRPNDRDIILAWSEASARAGDHAAAARALEGALDYFTDDGVIVDLFERESKLAEEG